jgi:NTP pyrophosphatase (non-canonical NTP hydrolase)
MKNQLQEIYRNSDQICRNRNWDKDWLRGGCYLHLECSEFIEALRGKGSSSPVEEAGDVIFALFAILSYYELPIDDVFATLEKKIDKMLEEDKRKRQGPL